MYTFFNFIELFSLSSSVISVCHLNFKASIPEVDRQDTSAIYRKLQLSELQHEIPQINWREYLQHTLSDIQLYDNETLVCYAMPYLKQMGKILAEADKRTIHNYILWRLVRCMPQNFPNFLNVFFGRIKVSHTFLPPPFPFSSTQVMSVTTHMIDDYQRERVEFRKILLGIQSERHRW